MRSAGDPAGHPPVLVRHRTARPHCRLAEEIDRPFGWELVVGATGNAAAIQDGIGRVGPSGTFLQFGVGDYATRIQIEPYRISNKEVTITGRWPFCSPTSGAELFRSRSTDGAR